MPEVSVIITCYNEAVFVENALQSVLKQTFLDFDVFVVDDGSEDNTREIILPYTKQHNVKYMFQKNRGLPAARNKGIQNSRGEYLAFLDADDSRLLQKLEKQIKYAEKHPGTALIYTDFYRYNEKGERFSQGYPKSYKNPEKFLPDIFMRDASIIPSTVIIKRDVLKDVGYFDEELLMKQEYDLWIRIGGKYPIGYANEPLVNKVERQDSLTKRNGKLRLEYQLLAAEKAVEKFPSLAKYKEKRFAKAYYDFGLFYYSINKPQEARKAFVKAIEHDYRYWKTYPMIVISLLGHKPRNTLISLFRKTLDIFRALRTLAVK